ncbi:hypothetical protein C2E23DRAFT_868171 [Lenzites betulinus]|nr:hypothetical protein C2E23DRAFT_868171 [Lenzites betulinus]
MPPKAHPCRKGKAPPTEPSAQAANEQVTADHELEHADTSSEGVADLVARMTCRCVPSQKQAEIAEDRCALIEKQVLDATNKLKKLKQLAKKITTDNMNEEQDTGDNNDCKSEEEDNTVFESRGIYAAPLPASNPAATTGGMLVPYHAPAAPLTATLPSAGPFLPRTRAPISVQALTVVNAHCQCGCTHILMGSKALRTSVKDTGVIATAHPPARYIVHTHPHARLISNLMLPNTAYTSMDSTRVITTVCPLAKSIVNARPISKLMACWHNTVRMSAEDGHAIATAVPAPFATATGQEPTGKPKASDYEDSIKQMINHACDQYEALLVTEDPYPFPGVAVAWAARVWADVSRSSPYKYQLTGRIEKIITGRNSHARGVLRNRMCPLIAQAYGLSKDVTDHAKQQKMGRYTYLLDRNTRDSPEAQFHFTMSFAGNRIIKTVIKDLWFSGPEAPGVKYTKQFSPMREVTLTLIFTTIEYCLDQWGTGNIDRELVKFLHHLRYIQEWGSLDPPTSQAIRQHMHNRARRASGAPAEVLPPTGLSDAARKCLRLDMAAQIAENLDG